MGWRDNLRAASFAGAAFKVRRAETSGGRRTAVHEFAGADKHQAEDLGLKARSFTVEGYVIGQDYMSARDALQAALESGTGQLVHPYRGTLQVICQTYRITETADDGGMATFSMEFVDQGEAANPSSAISTSSLVSSRADSASAASVSSFDDLFDTGGTSWQQAAAQEQVADMVSAVSEGRTVVGDAARYAKIAANLADMDSTTLASKAASGSLGTELSALFQVADDSGTVTSLFGAVQDSASALSNAQELLALFDSTSTSSSSSASTTSSAAAIEDNATAVINFFRQQSVAEAARAASTTDPETASDALALSASLTTAIDEVLAETEDDTVHNEYTGLRAAVVSDLSTRAARLPEVETVTLSSTSNSLAVAQSALADGSRADEIVTRNAVRHPGFIAPGSLEVLNG